MAYFETINLVQGDTKPQLNFTLRDSTTAIVTNPVTILDKDDSSTWIIIDISGVAIELKFRAINSTTVLSTISCSVSSGIGGACFMIWPAGVLDVAAGIYEGELQLTMSDGTVQTVYDKLKFKIREQF
tara:strand:+ start:116 stop:499 length:384 start_codon:yes stop_codon:yes gene_type:complete